MFFATEAARLSDRYLGQLYCGGLCASLKADGEPSWSCFSKRSLLDQVKAVCAETSALQTSRCIDAPAHVSTRKTDIGTHATNTIRPVSQFFPHIPGNESLGGHAVLANTSTAMLKIIFNLDMIYL